MHIVLEYDAGVFELRESWERCGVDFDRLMSYLGRHFGKCSIILCFDAHESAYCHIYLVVLFHDHVFQGRRFKKRYRVFGDDWNTVKKGWSRGYSNVEMVDSVGDGAYYLRKYLAKSVSVDKPGSKGIKGLAMCWFTRRRSFSISGEFRGVNSDVVNTNSNSNNEKAV